MQGNGKGAGEEIELKEMQGGVPRPTEAELKTRAGRVALMQLKTASPEKSVSATAGAQEKVAFAPFRHPAAEALVQSGALGHSKERRGGIFIPKAPRAPSTISMVFAFKNVDAIEQTVATSRHGQFTDAFGDSLVLVRKALQRLDEVLPPAPSAIPRLSIAAKEAILYSIIRFFEVAKECRDIHTNLLCHYAIYLESTQYFTYLVNYVANLVIKCRDIGAVNPLLKVLENYLEHTDYFGPFGSRAREEVFVDRRSVATLIEQLNLWVLAPLKSFYALAEPYLTEGSTPDEHTSILDIIANTSDGRISFETCRQALMILCEVADYSTEREALATLMKQARPEDQGWWQHFIENVVGLAKASAIGYPFASPDSPDSHMDLLGILKSYLPALEQALSMPRQPDSPWRVRATAAGAPEAAANSYPTL